MISPFPLQISTSYRGARETTVAANAYEEELKAFFPGDKGFDILLLGIGHDGHTASLFPHTEVLDQKERWVYPVEKEGIKHERITLTAPFLNKSNKIVMVAYGRPEGRSYNRYLEWESPTT